MTVTYWIFVISTLSLIAFIGYGTFATARLLQNWQPDGNVLLLPAENIFRVVLILVCIGLGWLSGLDRVQLGWQLQNPGRQVVWGLFIGLGLGIFFYYSTAWFMKHTAQRFYSTVIIELIVPNNRQEVFLVWLAMAPTVVLEELLFRSLLLGGLEPLVSRWVLLGGGSIVFGIFHSPQGIWGMVGTAVAGLLLGVLFLWQSSLLLPVIVHYIINMFQIMLAMQARQQKNLKTGDT